MNLALFYIESEPEEVPRLLSYSSPHLHIEKGK
ncbi:hypothetical protein KIS4809_0366 [Bacillus sp. ZZV12-4809]|nr:hypothetical protein KIS4809_0366 [Bacillus sp. ZZV12-4809]